MRGIIHKRRVFILFSVFSLLTVFMIAKFHRSRSFLRPWPSLNTKRNAAHYKASYPRVCNATKRILFLKTHKTGGSTITNIVNRFADRNNLTFALPHYKSYRFGWPAVFKPHFINQNRLRYEKPDILCNHARYNWKAMSAAMPNGTVFFTVLRHPVPLFESVFSYFELPRWLNISGKSLPEQIRNFFKNPQTFLKRIGHSGRLIYNGMMFDLGLNETCYQDEVCIKKHIKHLEDKFSLLLVTEYFDESLVLLKRELCWTLEDVTYFVFLKRRTKTLNLPADVRKLILNFNRADSILYDHFNKSLWRKIERQDSQFFEEVAQLKALNRLMYDQCTSEKGGSFQHLTKIGVESVRLNLKANLTGNEKISCCRMIRDEIQYVHYNNKKQIPFEHLWMKASPDMGC